MVLEAFGRQCMKCKRMDGPMCVDHIVAKGRDAQKKLDPNNLQVLCPECNRWKNHQTIDYRNPIQKLRFK